MDSMRSKKLLYGAILATAVLGSVFLYASWKNVSQEQPADTSTPSKKSEESKDDKTARLACVAAMPLKEKLGQKLMAAGFAAQLENQTTAFAAAHIGGVIMMDEASADQIAAFKKAMTIPPLVAVDQEGGTVQRYKGYGSMPGALHMAMDHSAGQAYQLYLADSDYLKARGITTNFAPVVDVMSRNPNPLPGRMYSDDPSLVSAYAAAHIRAANESGITPVVKHFPGLGSAGGNTDFMTATTEPFSSLLARDLLPYEQLAELKPDVMVGNMIVPDLTNGQPAIWSQKTIQLLRSIGYENAVVYSDSLTAEAVLGTLSDAVLKAWSAGIDVAVIVQADTKTPHLAGFFEDVIDHTAAAVDSGAIGIENINESVLRIFERKQFSPCQPDTTNL